MEPSASKFFLTILLCFLPEMLHLKRNVNGYYYLRGDAAPSMKENAEQFDITMVMALMFSEYCSSSRT